MEGTCKLVDKTYAVIDGDVFDYLLDISHRHNCGASVLLGIYVASQLDRWKPHFKKSMVYFFGKEAEVALDALHLEGYVVPDEDIGRELVKNKRAAGHEDGSAFRTPVDTLAEAWVRAGGDQVAGITRRRLHSQTAPKYTDGTAKMPEAAARIYRALFPKGNFQTFVTDCFRHSSSIDQATVALAGGELSVEMIERWKSIWKIAAMSQPSSKASGDPYLFLCCALNPLFDRSAFSKNLENYTLWDAITLSTCRQIKKQPSPEALRRGGDE
jgi:hypothetical protein